MVSAVTPISASASLTSMSLYGWITASIFFIDVGSPSWMCRTRHRGQSSAQATLRIGPDALLAVEREIQREHIHARLSEEAELTALGVTLDKVTDDAGIELASLGHATDLVERRRR